jgi:DNA replication protein DnaC
MSQNKDPKAPAAQAAPDELHKHLAYLNLPFMRQQVEELARQAADKQWSHLGFLGRLVEGEAALRQDRARVRRIHQARFPVLKTFDQFDFTWPAKINRLAVGDLFRLKFIQDRANVVIIGGVGLGKSHLAIALGYAACLEGFRVRFATAIDIVNTLAAADRIGLLHAELKKYTRPDLLIIDELGYLPIDQHGANLLFQVISGRYERGSMLFTTNQVFKYWSTIFCNDATLTSAILDRIVHHSQTIIIEGKSFRMKDRIEP